MDALLGNGMKRKQQTTRVAWASCSKRQTDTSGSIITVDDCYGMYNTANEVLVNKRTTAPTFIEKKEIYQAS